MIRNESFMDESFGNIENSDIIIRYLSHETTIAETQLVDRWINESVENKVYFENIKRIYENKLNQDESIEFNVNKAWTKLELQLPLNAKESTIKFSFGNNIRRIGLAAVKIAAIVVLLLGIIFTYYRINPKQVEVASYESIVNQLLPDGSRISLNKNSSIQYPSHFSKRQREISLVGEAFFEVKKNASIPFIIHINDVDIEVVGTSFNVNAYPNDERTEVVVKTGIVKVTTHDANNKIIVLKAGEKAEFIKKSNSITKLDNNNPNYIGWKTKVYVFEMTKMADVFKTIEKDFNVSITVTDNNFNQCNLFARFENNSLEEILTIIKHTFNVNYQIDGRHIVIDGKGCSKTTEL